MIERSEFASLQAEFFTNPVTVRLRRKGLSRFSESSESVSWEEKTTSGLVTFSNDKTSFAADSLNGVLAEAEGSALFMTDKLVADGLADDVLLPIIKIGDQLIYLGTAYEIIQVVPIGPADGNSFVLQKIYFKKTKV